jgi:hypothetical protein
VKHGNGSLSLATDQPDGSVVVFLDESYAPFVAAGAVVVESTDVLKLDSGVTATYDKLKNWYYLGDMPSFEEFRERGFHATNDPFEVRAAFVAFLSEALNFKSLIVYSSGSVRGDCGRSRNSRCLRSRISAGGGSVLMFYSLSSFVVTPVRPGRLFGR